MYSQNWQAKEFLHILLEKRWFHLVYNLLYLFNFKYCTSLFECRTKRTTAQAYKDVSLSATMLQGGPCTVLQEEEPTTFQDEAYHICNI